MILLLVFFTAAAYGADVLWYAQPASQWTEALPVGNGRLGAMVFGGVGEERLQLNEDTVWAGEKRDRNNPAGAAAIPEVRRLLLAGKVKEAEELADRAIISIPRRLPPYQPLGDLRLRFSGLENPSGYRRELDLDSGIARVAFTSKGAAFRREVFSSAVDGVLVVRLEAGEGGHLNFTAALSRQQDAAASVSNGQIVLEGQAIARDPRHPDERQTGVRFRAVLGALAEGGVVRVSGSELAVENARAATLILAAATNLRGKDPAAECARQLTAAMRKPYAVLRSAHAADHQRLFRRVKLHFDVSEPALPTDERLRRVREGAADPALEALYFQFGRYLLMGSSRPGTLAANLQGIWNDQMAPAWDSKFTININTEMNYWPAEACNLSELHEPLFDLVEHAREDGRRVARNLWGARGFVLHHNTDGWGHAVPIDGVGSGIWPMGAAWLSLHYWDRWDFTRDREFLARRAYPVLKEAAEFLLDSMFRDTKGRLLSGPSISPENRFRTADGQVGKLCLSPTMDVQIAHALFSRAIEAARVLGVDAEFRKRAAEARAALPPMQIGRHGQLQEWLEDYDEPEPGHRHISHLFALHPGNQITLRGTPELAKAARVSLERRLKAGSGHTGWSRAWVVNFWARFEEGDLAHENLAALLAKSTYPNLLDNHPPFQIDGNFGGTAGMAEMLVQSHAGEIAILPALPKAWGSGAVSGLRARGAVGVDIRWSSASAEAALTPSFAGKQRVRAPKGRRLMSVRSGPAAVKFTTLPDGAAEFPVRGGSTYRLVFR